MSMQDGTRTPNIRQKQVQCGFSRGTTCSLDHRSVLIHTHEIVLGQCSFVQPGHGYREDQRLAVHYRTEITACT